jgi:hypothetical protein
MHGWQKTVFWGLLGVGLLCNTSCYYIHPRHGLAVDQMHDVLQESIRADTPHTSQKRPYAIPAMYST